jgi:hypothetical protein
MRKILKLSVVCWGIVFAFFLFFLVPFETLSARGAAITAGAAGLIFLAGLALYIHRLRGREGFEFGWFLAQKHGLRLIFLAGAALVLLAVSVLWFIAPPHIWQPVENGAMPVAILLVLLFWFAIIFMFLGFGVVCFAESAAYLRVKDFKWSAGSFALALFWLALGTGCCSLFLDVINDNFAAVSGRTRWWVLISVAAIAAVVGVGIGGFQTIDKILPENEAGQNRER